MKLHEVAEKKNRVWNLRQEGSQQPISSSPAHCFTTTPLASATVNPTPALHTTLTPLVVPESTPAPFSQSQSQSQFQSQSQSQDLMHSDLSTTSRSAAIESLMTARLTPTPTPIHSKPRASSYKRSFSERGNGVGLNSTSSKDIEILEIIDARSRSHLEKRTRICPEKIPDGSILQGNISQSALVFEKSDERGPSTFKDV